jgi:hypothetical protein
MQTSIPERGSSGSRLFRATLAIVAAFACSAVLAQASLRMLPPNAKKGDMNVPEQGKVVIDGKTYQLAPGLRLRDTSNVIVFPHSVTAAATVRYTVDAMGLVDRIWILTALEKTMPDPPQPDGEAPR